MPYTEIEIYNKANELMKAYIKEFKDQAQDIETLRLNMVDEEFIKIMEERKGRHVLISWAPGNIDDPPIYWKYSKK